MEFAVNTLRRKVPTLVNGKRKKPFHQTPIVGPAGRVRRDSDAARTRLPLSSRR